MKLRLDNDKLESQLFIKENSERELKGFNTTEKAIIRYLYYTKLNKSASQVAKKINVSYPTAKKYLVNLVKMKVLIKREIPSKRKLKNVKIETSYHFDVGRSPNWRDQVNNNKMENIKKDVINETKIIFYKVYSGVGYPKVSKDIIEYFVTKALNIYDDKLDHKKLKLRCDFNIEDFER